MSAGEYHKSGIQNAQKNNKTQTIKKKVQFTTKRYTERYGMESFKIKNLAFQTNPSDTNLLAGKRDYTN